MAPRFADIRRLGRGAEGGTWIARDATGRPVVLKHVPAARRNSLARVFEVLRGVASPHLPAVLELVGDGEGGAWLVTTYVDGEPLGPGPVPLEQALAEVMGVAHALAAIHGLGTHHADVSANNVIVMPTRGVVLTDLGQLGGVDCGTPGFLAPEVLRGGGGPAADWFALASVLVLRLFGQVPWRRPERLLELARSADPSAEVRRRLHALADAAEVDLPGPVAALLERLLDPDPQRRVSDPRTIVARLRQLHRACSTGELTRAGPAWWLPSRWPFVLEPDQASELDSLVAELAAGRCRVLAIAGPSGSGRGRVVEEVIQRLQLLSTRDSPLGGSDRDTDSDAVGSARVVAQTTDPSSLAQELGAEAGGDWIDAWLAAPRQHDSARVWGLLSPPHWPGRLHGAELRAAVLRAGASLGAETLVLVVDQELGRRLHDARELEPGTTLRVLELEPWSLPRVQACLRAVVEEPEHVDPQHLDRWARVCRDVTGGWPARVIRAIEAWARAGVDDPDPAALERALIEAGSEPLLDPQTARKVLDRCWGLPVELPASLCKGSGEPLASVVAAARLSLGEGGARDGRRSRGGGSDRGMLGLLARTTLIEARESGRPIPLALALDADDADAIEAGFEQLVVTEPSRLLPSDLIAWLERGGAPQVGPRLRLRALRDLIRRGEAERALGLLQAIANTGTPSPAEALEGIRAREQLGRHREALEQLDLLIPQMRGVDRDRALGLRWRALVDAGRPSEARAEAEQWALQAPANLGASSAHPGRRASAEPANWRRAVAWLWGGLAVLYAGGEAEAWLARALADCAGEHGPSSAPIVAGLRARVYQLEANLAQLAGESERARERFRAAVEEFERAGETLGRVLVEGSLAALALEAGEWSEALARGRRALRGFLARAQVQTLPAALFNLVRALIGVGALDEGRRSLGLTERLCEAAGEPSQLARARLRRIAIELDVAELVSVHPSASPRSPRTRAQVRGQLGERMLACAAALEQAGALAESIDVRLAAAAWARADGQAHVARERLELAQVSAASHGGPELATSLALALEALAQAEGRDELEAAHSALAELPTPSELWSLGQRLLAWSYDRTLLGVLHRHGSIGDDAARSVAARLVRHLEALMAKAPPMDRRALRQSLLSEAGELAPLRELVRELEASEEQEEAMLASADPALEPVESSRSPQLRPSDTLPASPSPRPTPHEGGSERLHRLLKIFRRLAREDELQRLLEQIVEAMLELTDAERGVVVIGHGPERIEVAREFASTGEGVAFSRSIIQRVLEQGEPVLSVDAAADDRFDGSRSISHLNLRSVLAVPLVFRGELLGAAYVDHRLRRGNFDASDLALMEDFSDLAALAVAHARALASVRAQKAELERQQAELAKALERREVEVVNLREAVRADPERRSYRGMIGSSPVMQRVFRLVDRLAESEVPVVIYGESGTGKELVARAIHEGGPRRSKPFVAENCGAIPESLLESVLFGHARGAFTGAQTARPGLFEAAEGGTIFLDEIGETSPAMQTKLLRVLQEGEVRRLGETRNRKVDVRVIAASNRSLEQMVERGEFRQDLYYRINVVKLELPALRDRREDIPALVEHFLRRREGGATLELSAVALRKLVRYPWPGNVRELENEVQRWLALCEQRVMPEDLSPAIQGSLTELDDPDDLALRPRVERLERELIARAMERTGGNQTQAAQLLGLSRFGLQKKLKRQDEDGP